MINKLLKTVKLALPLWIMSELSVAAISAPAAAANSGVSPRTLGSASTAARAANSSSVRRTVPRLWGPAGLEMEHQVLHTKFFEIPNKFNNYSTQLKVSGGLIYGKINKWR